jgi:pimeloyl-ACP methyl ester carboxylesterase
MKIQVNGIDLDYEKTGTGTPIILLHGNGEDHRIFDVLVGQLSEEYSVYAVDSRNHGQSGSSDTLSYDMIAEDIVAFIKELGLDKPILYGFSDGGIVGLLIASRYPDLLSKLIISGANTNPAGMKPSLLLLLRVGWFITRNIKWKMAIEQPDITADELQKINIPVLVLAGSKDAIREEHTRELAIAIPGSTLNILDGEGHGSYIVHSPKLYGIIRPFLTGEHDGD